MTIAKQWWKLIEATREPDMSIAGYLNRWELARTSNDERVYLHHIIGPDKRVWHNHPWPFRTAVLQGWYESLVVRTGGRPEIELDQGQFRAPTVLTCLPHRPYSMDALDFHFISQVSDIEECWSIVSTGPRAKSWGFFDHGVYWDHMDYFEAHPEYPSSVFRDGYATGY